jgi:hypothetical protein
MAGRSSFLTQTTLTTIQGEKGMVKMMQKRFISNCPLDGRE